MGKKIKTKFDLTFIYISMLAGDSGSDIPTHLVSPKKKKADIVHLYLFTKLASNNKQNTVCAGSELNPV